MSAFRTHRIYDRNREIFLPFGGSFFAFWREGARGNDLTGGVALPMFRRPGTGEKRRKPAKMTFNQ
jgi:hypothetical protein